MANHDVTNPDFSTQLRELEISDKGHADTFNPLFKRLIKNDTYLEKKVEENASHLAETAKIIISEADIPISERKEGTFYCIITDKAKTVTNENIKVSPIMGLKIEE